ncbi:DUF748 domain-containing protein [Neptunicella sp.]|uniref:DUF748 domain-containing protein n=1 Tax=Neptunicella sp. TaxID=2125986 RepID=UPI003F68E073
MLNIRNHKTRYIGLCILVLVILRLAAPDVVKWYVNQSIDQSAGISGSVGDVDLYLWRAAYQLNNVEINQQDSQGKSYPLLNAKSVSMSLLWSSILAGHWITKMHFERPDIVLLKQAKQSAIKSDAILDEQTWIQLANKLVFFSIDTLTVNHGTFRFRAVAEQQQADFFINQLNGSVTNVTKQQQSTSMAQAEFTGKVLGKAGLRFSASFDPRIKQPTFDVDIAMSKLSAQHLDQLLDFYAPFDIEAGQVDISAELVAQQGQVDGYVKAGIYDLDIFSWHEDVIKDKDNPFALLIEMTSGLVAGLLENQRHDLVATRIPISGTLDDPDIPLTTAIAGLFHNAFIQAYKMDVEDLITFSDNVKK